MKTKKLQLYQTMVDMELEAVSLLIECSIHIHIHRLKKKCGKKKKLRKFETRTDRPTH